MPAWLVWLLPVPVATLAALAWASWSSRVRRPVDPRESVADYARFRRALADPPAESGERSGRAQ
jgi:hypothetical protein